MAENDAIRDDYEDKYLGGGEDDVTERLADIDDETAERVRRLFWRGLRIMTLMRKIVRSWAPGVLSLMRKKSSLLTRW